MFVLTIDVVIDDSRLLEVGRQVPFAMKNAMNRSMLMAQERVRFRMRALFTIRRPDFLKLVTKITQFAKKDLLISELAIAPPGGSVPARREDVFEKFESGLVKKPFGKNKNIAIPVEGSSVKRNIRSIVSDQNRPRVLLGDQSPITTRTGTKEVKRTKNFGGAFISPAKAGSPAVIFIRRGRHLELAYVLEPETLIDDNLKFEKTAADEFIKRFPTNFRNELAKATANAK